MTYQRVIWVSAGLREQDDARALVTFQSGIGCLKLCSILLFSLEIKSSRNILISRLQNSEALANRHVQGILRDIKLLSQMIDFVS